MQYWPSKGVVEITDRGLNWAPALSLLGDHEIADSSWEVREGIVVLSADSHTVNTTAVRLSGGEPKSEVIIRNIVLLSNGERYYEDVFFETKE